MVSGMQYPTVGSALDHLESPYLFERVVTTLLLEEHPGIELTSGPSDRGRDAVEREGLFGGETTIFQYSLKKRWSEKVRGELNRFKDEPPKAVVFVTSRATTTATREKLQSEALDLGIELTIKGRGWLGPRLTEPYRDLAEEHLQLAPRRPSPFLTAGEFSEKTVVHTPGFTAPLVGVDPVAEEVDRTFERGRIVVLVGAGGTGKTRLALEVAHSHGETLVLNRGMAFDATVVGRVPVDRPVTLVLDDAHRVPVLGGVRALLDDERWARTRLVLTTRPGMERVVFEEARLDPQEITQITVGKLGRRHIDAIVTGPPHRISHEPFRLWVIELAQGNPLIAHMAAQTALQQQGIQARTLAELLRGHLDRLLSSGYESAHHRRALGLIAVLGRVEGSDLPAAQENLPDGDPPLQDTIGQLADVGVLERTGDVYVIKPDRLVPLIVADTFFPPSGYPPQLAPELLQQTVASPQRLQFLEVLSDAVRLADGRGVGTLRSLAADQWPEQGERSARRWCDALNEAEACALALPYEVHRLLDAFVLSWPLDEGGEEESWLLRDRPEDALAAATRVATSIASRDHGSAVSHLLDLADLEAALSGEPLASDSGPKRDLERLLTEGHREWGTWITERGQEQLAVIRDWIEGDSSPRSRALAAEAAAHLVRVTYGFQRPSPESARTIQWGSFRAPETREHSRFVREAARFVGELVPELDSDGLLRVVDRLRKVYHVARGGLISSNLTITERQRRLLKTSARTIRDAFLERWEHLPLAVRYRIAELGRRSPLVRERMEGDSDLEFLITLYPPLLGGGDWRRREREAERGARNAAGDIPVQDGLSRLGRVIRDAEGMDPSLGMGVFPFVTELGMRTSPSELDAAVRLMLDSDGLRPFMPCYLYGFLREHPHSRPAILFGLVEEGYGELVVPVLDDVDPETEQQLVERLMDTLTATSADRLGWHASHCTRLEDEGKAELLLRIAERCDVRTKGAVLKHFGPVGQRHHVPVPPKQKRAFLRHLKTVTVELPFDRPTGGMWLEPAYRAAIEVDPNGLLDLLEARLVRLMKRDADDFLVGRWEEPVPPDMERALADLQEEDRDEGCRRVVSWVERYRARKGWHRIEPEVWELLYRFGVGRAVLRETLLSWSRGDAAARRLAICGLERVPLGELFDEVAQSMLRRRATGAEQDDLLRATDVRGIRQAGDPKPFEDRAAHFRAWLENPNRRIRAFATRAVEVFERAALKERQQAEELDERL